jgi:transposase
MMTLRLRVLTEEESRVITQMSQARSEEARLVERAKIIACASQGQTAPQIAASLQLHGGVVRKWLKRFNEQGLQGLLDAPRSGAPAQYDAQVRAKVIATALTNPKELDLPFASWTYQRLHSYLREQCGLRIGKRRMFELLQEEGLRWYKQEGWFGERVDPNFAEKRGPSSGCAAVLPPTVPSLISTRWGR